jgi:hypothetical protein
MFLYFNGFMQHRFGVVVRVNRTLVGRLTRNLLPDDNDRQQDKLQKRLRDPRDQGCSSFKIMLLLLLLSLKAKSVSAPNRCQSPSSARL